MGNFCLIFPNLATKSSQQLQPLDQDKLIWELGGFNMVCISVSGLRRLKYSP